MVDRAMGLSSNDVESTGRRRISSSPPAAGPTMSSRIVSRIADALAARGLDGIAACERVGIPRAAVHDVDAMVDASAYSLLWGEAVALSGDPWLPLDVARHAPDSQNLLRFVCMPNATLGEAFERASRFLRLVTNAVIWSFVVDHDAARFVSERNRDPNANDFFADVFFIAENITLARIATGQPSLAAREVRLAHPAPADATMLRVLLRAPVIWDAERTEIVFDRPTLDLPLVHADPSVAAFFEAYAAKLLQGRTSAPTVTDEVLRCVVTLLRGRTPSLDEVAEQLGASPRTLRRRLEAEGTSFQQVLDSHRRELSARLLLEASSSLAEIAFVLGFADPTSFQRAFRRWYGTLPAQFVSDERLRRARSA